MYILKLLKVSFILILTATLVACLSIFASAEIITGFCGVNNSNPSHQRYSLDTETGVLTISGTGGMGPWRYWKNYTSSIRSIIVEEGVSGIGGEAFSQCTNLEKVSLPSSLSHIESYAFRGCTALKEITLPEGVLEIKTDVFRGCSSLQRITLPKTLKQIGTDSFAGCTQLTEIHYNGEIADWINIPLYFNQAHPFYEVRGASGGKLYCNGVLVTDVVIPENAKIRYASFVGCKSLRSVTIPDSVTEIYSAAFYNCTPYIICSEGSQASKISGLTKHYFTHVSKITQNTATCTESGIASFACTECSYTYSESLNALGHATITHVAKLPTCTETGWSSYETCARCSYNTYSELAALDHDFSGEWIIDAAPTCTDTGEQSHECLRCEIRGEITEIPALGHTETETVLLAPTVNSTGAGKYFCSVCGNEEFRIIFALADYNANGAIDVADILVALQIFLNRNSASYLDMNNDGTLGLIDIIRLLKIATT